MLATNEAQYGVALGDLYIAINVIRQLKNVNALYVTNITFINIYHDLNKSTTSHNYIMVGIEIKASLTIDITSKNLDPLSPQERMNGVLDRNSVYCYTGPGKTWANMNVGINHDPGAASLNPLTCSPIHYNYYG